MPRLFTAIALPDEVRQRLSMLRGGLRGARFIDPDNYHITLRFIGDVDDRTADDAAEALGRIRRGPVKVRIVGVGSFGGRRPHAVHAAVQPTSELTDLHAEQERVLQRIGLPPEPRRFVPHVTLARLRSAKAGEVADWLTVRGGFQAPEFIAHEVALMSSKASVGGGPYLTEGMYALDLARAA